MSEILAFLIFLFVGVLSNNNMFIETDALKTLEEITKQTSGLEKKDSIDVGRWPAAIAINEETDTVYVANSGSATVSVISAKNNTKIGEDITVGNGPAAIAINEETDTVYVANSASRTVSVISAKNNTKIGEIDVGSSSFPAAIALSSEGAIYVANSASRTVSVIADYSNKVVIVIKFRINPLYAGHIECKELLPPISQYFFIQPDTGCIAKPNKGFEFLSWEENLKDNSTQLIAVS